jgi:RNA polymerase sigma-70 factor (ECF subfamily)
MDDLVAEQGPALTRRLARILGDPHAAEDLCQEAFARAWSSAPPGLSRDRLAAWLHRTATNLALDELRRRRIRQAAPLDDALDGAAPSDPHRALHIREALARLTAHERLLLLLRFEGGLRHREIADLLALPEATARKRSRARAGRSPPPCGRRPPTAAPASPCSSPTAGRTPARHGWPPPART